MKSKNELKAELRELVQGKIENTRTRLGLKAIPYSERSDQQHREMLGCWDTGSDMKESIRHVGLAYAFVRGQRYWEVERHTKDGPMVVHIAAYADVTCEEVQAWLEVPVPAEEARAYQEHLQESRERVRAARARRAA